MWDLNLAWKSWHKKGRPTGSFKGEFWGLKNVSKLHHSSNIWYWTVGRDQKQMEQICMPTNKIKFIKKFMKYDICAKLRVIFTLQVPLESNPQFHPCTALQWKGLLRVDMTLTFCIFKFAIQNSPFRAKIKLVVTFEL